MQGPTINPEYEEKEFKYSFTSLRYKEIKKEKLQEEIFKKVVKTVEILRTLQETKVLWKHIPSNNMLYSGHQARCIKK